MAEIDLKLNKKILILADDRPGTYSQAIALAKELGYEYEILKINYSPLIVVPNFILKRSILRYDFSTQKKLENIDNFDIVISAGRRSVAAALYLQQKLKNVKIIQIMNPNVAFRYFDYVILPQHDDVKDEKNLIKSAGAITNYDEDLISKEMEIFDDFFKKINKKIITLLVGGAAKNTKFSKKEAINLANLANKYTCEIDAKLIILTSPRTSDEISQNLLQNIECDHEFFDFKKITKNPYKACLGKSDYFIVSGDSVSMISECLATKKPVLIFDENNISNKKHRKFHQFLFKNSYAFRADDSTNIKSIKMSKSLNEAKRISGKIKEDLNNNNFKESS